jgi:hypothetical protein
VPYRVTYITKLRRGVCASSFPSAFNVEMPITSFEAHNILYVYPPIFSVLDYTPNFQFPQPLQLVFCVAMDAVQFQTHSCDQCRKAIFDLRHIFEKTERAVLDLVDQIEKGTLGANPPPQTNEVTEKNMAEDGALFDFTLDELCTGAAAGCQLFKWIMDDEWISRKTIHSIAQRDMMIDDPNEKSVLKEWWHKFWASTAEY